MGLVKVFHNTLVPQAMYNDPGIFWKPRQLQFHTNGNQLGDLIAMEGKLGIVFCRFFFRLEGGEGVT